jgi:iron-sulfur cluster assembly protein
MAITITESAIEEIKRFRAENNMGDEDILCVAVTGGGCAGFTYKMSFLKKDQLSDKFNFYEFHGETVVVDKRSDLYLQETTVDFYSGLDKRGFVFDNKAATGRCGCGSSFTM